MTKISVCIELNMNDYTLYVVCSDESTATVVRTLRYRSIVLLAPTMHDVSDFSVQMCLTPKYSAMKIFIHQKPSGSK